MFGEVRVSRCPGVYYRSISRILTVAPHILEGRRRTCSGKGARSPVARYSQRAYQSEGYPNIVFFEAALISPHWKTCGEETRQTAKYERINAAPARYGAIGDIARSPKKGISDSVLRYTLYVARTRPWRVYSRSP